MPMLEQPTSALRRVTFTTLHHEKYVMAIDDATGTCSLDHVARTGTVKAHYELQIHPDGTVTCAPTLCTESHFGGECEHVKALKTVMQYCTSAKRSISPFETLCGHLQTCQDVMHELTTSFLPLFNTGFLTFLQLWREEHRPHQVSDYRFVYEDAESFLQASGAQCLRCLQYTECTDGVRRGMACLAAILWEKLELHDREAYTQIPITETVLNCLSFLPLLILAYYYHLNFSTMIEFSQIALRGRLLEMQKENPYTLTA